MTHADIPAVDFGPATRSERAAALALLFAHLPPAERNRRLARSLRDLAAAGPNRPELWVARRGADMLGAMWSEVQAGKTALVSPPRTGPGEPAATAQALAKAVVSHLSRQEVRLAQALVDMHPAAPIAVLEANGFHHITDLLYLVSLCDKFPDSPPQSGLEFAPCDEADDSALAAIVERTYAGSLDCPAIEGWRDVNDVLDGYRAVDASISRRWLIVRSGQLDVGCLLLNDSPELNQWELVYMGLVGEARGRGWGVALVRYAQWLARQAGRAQLVLAVDAANAPAIAVYAAAGFITWDRRAALVRKF